MLFLSADTPPGVRPLNRWARRNGSEKGPQETLRPGAEGEVTRPRPQARPGEEVAQTVSRACHAALDASQGPTSSKTGGWVVPDLSTPLASSAPPAREGPGILSPSGSETSRCIFFLKIWEFSPCLTEILPASGTAGPISATRAGHCLLVHTATSQGDRLLPLVGASETRSNWVVEPTPPLPEPGPEESGSMTPAPPFARSGVTEGAGAAAPPGTRRAGGVPGFKQEPLPAWVEGIAGPLP